MPSDAVIRSLPVVSRSARMVDSAGLWLGFSRLAKYAAVLVLLVYARSLPFVWHGRVFRYVFYVRLRYYLFRLSLFFKPKKIREKASSEWFEQLSPVGQNPFDMVTVHKTWASIDEIDFNLHLSNSSYPKTIDATRMKTVLKTFPSYFRTGGWMVLGGTHFHFLREIPMLSNYEVRCSIGGWDNKWIFLICRFVSTSKRSKSKTSKKAQISIPPTPVGADAIRAPLRTPADGETTDTPSDTSDPNAGAQAEETASAMKALANAQLRTEPDGAILHCFSISQMCFKIGRITVPPAVVLASEGYSVPPPAASSVQRAAYSYANPPPNWVAARKLRVGPEGNMRKIREFFAGGWRSVPERERWWEEPLGGAIEEKRKLNMEALDLVRRGMDEGRESY